MSVYAIFDEATDGDQVATIKGWGDFTRWVDGLPADQYPQLAHVSEYAWTQKLSDLAAEIDKALTDAPPNEDVRDVAATLLSTVRAAGDAEVMMISDGLTTEAAK